ncbi:hypothetical protein F5880DRAFT_337142 [Lentinula raphanica]|nr:hypothetical protein F5880DRAFT_337142 [Lentinula raphanica]
MTKNSNAPNHYTIHPSTTHTSTSHPSTSHPSTSHPSTSHPSTSHPSISHPSTTHPTMNHPWRPTSLHRVFRLFEPCKTSTYHVANILVSLGPSTLRQWQSTKTALGRAGLQGDVDPSVELLMPGGT